LDRPCAECPGATVMKTIPQSCTSETIPATGPHKEYASDRRGGQAMITAAMTSPSNTTPRWPNIRSNLARRLDTARAVARRLWKAFGRWHQKVIFATVGTPPWSSREQTILRRAARMRQAGYLVHVQCIPRARTTMPDPWHSVEMPPEAIESLRLIQEEIGATGSIVRCASRPVPSGLVPRTVSFRHSATSPTGGQA